MSWTQNATNVTSLALGITDGSNAPAGYTKEYFEVVVASSAGATLTTSTPQYIVTLPLPIGDWDVGGNFYITGATVTSGLGWISSASTVAVPDLPYLGQCGASSFGAGNGAVVPFQRFNITTATNVYIGVDPNFTGTATGCGRLFARRSR